MLCEECKKNLATVHYTEVVNNKLTEYHLCKDCADNRSLVEEPKKSESSLANYIASISGEKEGSISIEPPDILKCANCSTTFSDFKKLGRLGCSDCYDIFRKPLNVLLLKIHGKNSHEGKVLKKKNRLESKEDKIERLKKEMQKAIEMEEFEKAADFRDKIRKLNGLGG